MKSNTARPSIQTGVPRHRWTPRLVWIAGAALLTLVGCVSNSTYEAARTEAKERYGELARTQADIQGLERQRDTLHTSNRQDEQSLANLKAELKKIQASYDQIQKANRDKLAALQHSIAALRARHQAMLKEISETKRHEQRLKAITSTYEKVMGKPFDGPEAHAITVDGTAIDQKLVAMVTPQAGSATDPAPVPVPAPAQSASMSPADANAPAAHTMTQQPTPTSSAPVVTATVPPADAAKAASTVPKPAPQPAPQEESWFTTLTAWFTSLFDWIWA